MKERWSKLLCPWTSLFILSHADTSPLALFLRTYANRLRKTRTQTRSHLSTKTGSCHHLRSSRVLTYMYDLCFLYPLPLLSFSFFFFFFFFFLIYALPSGIGHFRVLDCFIFKASLSAKFLL